MNSHFIVIAVLIVFLELSVCENDPPWIGKAKDGSWPRAHERLVNQTLAHKNEIQIVFIGDSITEKWTQNGKKIWDKYYVPRHAFNYGIGGDRTENVIYRVQHKELDEINPKVVVLKIGTNNLNMNESVPADVAKGIKTIVQLLETKMPKTPILLLGVLPRGHSGDIKVQELDKVISKYGDNKKVYYLDMSAHFESAPGIVIPDLFLPRSAHLTEKGYQVWHDVMEPLLVKLLAKH